VIQPNAGRRHSRRGDAHGAPRLVALLLVAALLAGVAARHAAAQDSASAGAGTITGVVLDQEDKLALPNARVGIYRPDPTGTEWMMIAGDLTGPEGGFDRRPPDNDGEYESAFDSLSCTPAGPASTMRVCRRDLDDGEPCGSSGACLSGICEVGDVPREGICVPKRRNGEACEAHVQCESGACQNGEPRTCGPKLAEGAPCDYSDAACASGTCHSGDGNGGVCGPAPGRMLGESCSNSFECISTGHGGSRDGTCHEGRCVADVCVPFLP
jgi:hypothetical protein